MKYRIFPKKEAVVTMFSDRIKSALSIGDHKMALVLQDELDLIESHSMPEIAVEIED